MTNKLPELVLFNGQIIQKKQPLTIGKLNITAYEVIRIIDGKVLFLFEHLARLQKSMFGLGFGVNNIPFSPGEIIKYLKLCNTKFGNIRIDVFVDGDTLNYQAYFIPHHYPSKDDYTHGVDLALLFEERKNPYLKIWDSSLREKADDIIKEQHVREVLLVNKQGHITEGSRSNVFFINNNIVFSPLKDTILEGITRKFILEAIDRIKDCSYCETEIPYRDISKFQSVFITGTSLKVLPVKKIAENHFNSQNALLIKICNSFEEIMYEHLVD